MAHRDVEPGLVEDSVFDPQPSGYSPDPSERWWGNHLGELRWQLELARLLIDPVFRGYGIPRGNGMPVMAIPGFLAGDTSLAVMRSWLSRIGYEAHGAAIALNVACSERAVNDLERRLVRIASRAVHKVALIGHSRGAHFAKALASRRPELVATVVSIGAGLDAPFDISMPTQVAVGLVRGIHARTSDRTARNGCFTASCRCGFTRDYRAEFPPEVPLTSIYSKGDGVVRWRACVVPYARCVEVSGSHVGLAFNRKVYRELAQTLARDGVDQATAPAGSWGSPPV
ncbi:MAG TPA: alpha/beta hydrolase [Mycobacterium sp.]|nr:alpha/beta hydrolase [Mycobacterium sp.]